MSSRTSQLPRWRSLTPEERQAQDALRQLLRQVAVATQGGMPVATAMAAHVPSPSSATAAGPALTRDISTLPGLWHLLRAPGGFASRVRHLLRLAGALAAASFIIALWVLLVLALLHYVPAPYGMLMAVALGIPAMAWLFVWSLAPAPMGDMLMLSDELMGLHASRLAAHMERGRPLAEALAHCFPQAPAGFQQAARLLDRGDHAEARLMLRVLHEPQNRMRRGLAPPYLSWLVLILASVSIFIILKILPKFQEIFAQLGAELPQLTQSMLDAANPTLFKLVALVYLLLMFFRHQSLERGLLFGFVLGYPLAPVLDDLGFLREMIIGRGAGGQHSGASAMMALTDAWLVIGVLIAASKLRLMGFLDITAVAGLLPPVRHLRRMRAQARFLGMLATHDTERLSLAELGEALATLEASPRGPLVKFANALHAGADLPAVLQSPGMHPLEAWQARQLALAARVGHLQPAAQSLLDDLEAERHRAAHQLRSLVQFGLLLTLAFVTAIVVIALYMPLFYIPAIVQPLG